MTKEQVIYELRTNPRLLITEVIHNNPNAVNTKLRAATDYEGATAEQITDYVLQLLDEGHVNEVNEIVQVPFNYDSATPVLIEAYDQMVNDRGATVQGKFLDSSGGLFLMATTTGTGRAAAKRTKASCKCTNAKGQKVITITNKHLLIAAVIIAIITYFIYKKIKN